MRYFMPLLAAAALFLSSAPAQADLGDQLFKLLPDDGAGGDWFGMSVAISGATAIVAAWRDDDNGDNSGSAYLFDRTTGQQIAKLLPKDGAASAFFGNSVAISGTTAIIGAWADNSNGPGSGSAYLFEAGTSACPEDSDGRVTICHVPPGNPENAHTITVSVRAVPAHLAHGDHCGPCEEGDGPLLLSGGVAGDEPCLADLDDSGDVGPADLAELLGAWGPNLTHPA